MSDEALYRQMREEDEADEARMRQNVAPEPVRKKAAAQVDYTAALKRFEQDFKPVFERRKKARTSKAYRIFLKAIGAWPKEGLDGAEVVEPTKGLKLTGPTPEEIAYAIQENPEAYKHLAKTAPKITPV